MMQEGSTTTAHQVLIDPPSPKMYHKNTSLTFDQLRVRLHELFSQDAVNVEEVQNLMNSYRSDPREWKTYAKFDRFK
jgi:hypothetical protein